MINDLQRIGRGCRTKKQNCTINWVNGTKLWYVGKQLHRDDGPAVEYTNCDKMWYRFGKLHRDDGPAIEYADGKKAWFLNGISIQQEDVQYMSGTEEDYMYLKLKYGI